MEPKTFYNRDAEEALLGAILIAPELFKAMPIDPDGAPFYIHKHRFIWETMAALDSQHEPVDYLTVSAHLEMRKATSSEFKNLLDEIGGAVYLMGLVQKTPTSLNAEAYARIVLDLHDRRLLIKSATQILQDAYNEEVAIPEVVTRASQSLSKSLRVEGGAHHWREDLSRVFDKVAARVQNPTLLWGVPTGFPGIDTSSGGLHGGELIILAGSPGVGKSLLFRQILRQVAAATGYAEAERANKPDYHNVLAYSLEMSDEFVSQRDLSADSEIPNWSLNTGFFNTEEEDYAWTDFVASFERLSNLNIYQSDKAKWTPAEMRADIARIQMELHSKGEKLDLVGIDYLYLMVPGVEGKNLSEHEKAEYLTTEMKVWAREFDVPIVAINSMNKDGFEDGKPGMSKGRGGAGVYHNADIVWFLTKAANRENGPKFPDGLLTRLTTLWMVKGRNIDQPDGFFDLIRGARSPWMRDAMTHPLYAEIVEEHARKGGQRVIEQDQYIEAMAANWQDHQG